MFLCLVVLMRSRLFIASLWSPAEKWLTSCLLLMMFNVFLLLSDVVSCVRCGTHLIVSFQSDLCRLSYLKYICHVIGMFIKTGSLTHCKVAKTI